MLLGKLGEEGASVVQMASTEVRGERARGSVSFVVLYRSGQFFPRKQLRQETVERFHDDGQSFPHVLDGFRDLFTFVLALAVSIRFESLLVAAQQSA